MKKRVRILISLLMISGSLTITSKSYAEFEQVIDNTLFCSGTSIIVGGFLYGFEKTRQKIERLLAANRAAKIGTAALARKKRDVEKLVVLGGGSTGMACAVLIPWLIPASASEITESPSLAMQNDEKFRLLVESVGIDPALELVGRIADGESRETVMNSLALLLEQNSNTEKDSFLDSGHEEELGAQ